MMLRAMPDKHLPPAGALGPLIIPAEANKALPCIQQRLADSLLAVYLHGSAVASGLQLHSDIDLLVVVDQPMTAVSRQGLAVDLMRLSGHYPVDPHGRRPLELIVFLHTELAASHYPARCEFIYGEWLRQQYAAGEIPKPACDPELTLLLAQAQQEAISLIGPKASSLLPSIPGQDVHRAITAALPALMETLAGDERNVLLTLARMWRTVATGEFVSKDVAADWAAARLPAELAIALVDAREAYLGRHVENWRNRQQELRLTADSLHDAILANSFQSHGTR